MIKQINTLFVGGTFLIFILSGCSSSSFNSRYHKHKKTFAKEETSSVRFSSRNDSLKIKKNNLKTYSDPNKTDKENDNLPKEDFKIQTQEFLKKYKYLGKLEETLTKREKLLFEIIGFLDTPYQFGGNSLQGIDCSAFTQNVFKNALNINLPRTAAEQFNIGEKVSKENLRFGDLIFFDTTRRVFPGHVGIYLGNNLFAHASQSNGVIISSLTNNYYKTRLVGGRRVMK